MCKVENVFRRSSPDVSVGSVAIVVVDVATVATVTATIAVTAVAVVTNTRGVSLKGKA